MSWRANQVRTGRRASRDAVRPTGWRSDPPKGVVADFWNRSTTGGGMGSRENDPTNPGGRYQESRPTGRKGKGMTGKRKWHSLIDKVYRPRNLEAAWDSVRANKGAPGVDRQTIEQFEARKDIELERLHTELKEDRYRPLPVRRVMIPKPDGRERPLGVSTWQPELDRHPNGHRPRASRVWENHSHGSNEGFDA